MFNSNELISIIIPIYNTERYLHKCIDSVINQKYKNIEIILVNDGSTDNCGKICDKYAKEDRRIKVIHKKNQGVSAARNSAIEICTGEYIGFIDSDDWIEEDMFEVLHNKIIEYEADISICNICEDYSNKGIDDVMLYNKHEFCIEMFIGNSFEGYLCNKLFRSNLFDKVRLDEDIGIVEDLLLIYKIINSNEDLKVIYTKKELYHYIQRDDSALNKKQFSKTLYSKIRAFKYIYEDSLNSYPNLSEYIFKRYIEENIDVAKLYANSNCNDKKYILEVRKNILENYKDIIQCKSFNIKQKLSIFMIKTNLKLFISIYNIFSKARGVRA